MLFLAKVLTQLFTATAAHHAGTFVAAIQGLQQQFQQFASGQPNTPIIGLEQRVTALQQELSRAVRSTLCHDL